MKTISVVTPCYNEEGNVEELYERIRRVFEALPQYRYEHIFIDNCSIDGTPQQLRQLAARDRHVKVILNNRNFGHVRSPYYGLLQGRGDAVIILASDLQDPPELIPEFLRVWENGAMIVVGQKAKTEESPLFFAVRKMYYGLVNRLAEVELLQNVTGFGLYDQEVVRTFRGLQDAYPYVRGLISELGYPLEKVVYTQPLRRRGLSKNNFYTLYDLAMLGITSHSKVPLRIATMLGFAMSVLSALSGFAYLLYKLLFWNQFEVGIAPLVIGVFFISSVQLFFIGIIGEYIGFIHTQMLKRPLVIERERLNWEWDFSDSPLAPAAATATDDASADLAIQSATPAPSKDAQS
jgi:glycosyltransferase involved in cell wall biosynthesis